MVRPARRGRAGRRRTRASSSARSWALAASGGRDKADARSPRPASRDLGAWLEQLIGRVHRQAGQGHRSRSTASTLGARTTYGDDRRLRLPAARVGADAAQDAAVAALAERRTAGGAHRASTARSTSARSSSAGRSPPRVAGSILGINPFNQPDVEASKIATEGAHRGLREDRRAARRRRRSSRTVAVALYADRGATPRALQGGTDAGRACCGVTSGGWARATTSAHPRLRPDERRRPRPRCRRCAGSACATPGGRHLPRLRAALPALHRPGLQGRAEHRRLPPGHLPTTRCNCPVPGHKYTFGVVKAAQARGRPRGAGGRGSGALRQVHLNGDLAAGLRHLAEAVDKRRLRRETHMQIAMVGLGKMGANMVRRLMQGGHSCVVYDRGSDVVAALGEGGRDGRRQPRRTCVAQAAEAAGGVDAWCPPAAHRGPCSARAALLESGDTIVDGGNSFFKDDVRRSKERGEEGHPLRRRRAPAAACGARARLLPDGRRHEAKPSRTSSRCSRRWPRARATSRRRPG